MTLDACPQAMFVPAHIWTPHFSLFGAFSGFDSVEECFGDLSGHIRAVETGLSSDPPMNRRVPQLDRMQLVSHSDAHSPQKLGREANILDTALSYPAVQKALETGEGLWGTVEFFPEEGKYHLDGHRACGVCLTPEETDAFHGRCPVCGKRLTVGVAHRVEELSGRESDLSGGKPFVRLVPLPTLVSACLGKGEQTKGVQGMCQRLVDALGPEFPLLREVPLEDIASLAGEEIARGVALLRDGNLRWEPGYDGVFGRLQLSEK